MLASQYIPAATESSTRGPAWLRWGLVVVVLAVALLLLAWLARSDDEDEDDRDAE